tara:strand:- start:638 stop:1561 length:924 start_codon:yes stop_codon:yes gene_type:complete
MTILNNGNVGIGTTTPSKKLDVVGDIGTSADSKIGWVYNPGSDDNMYNYLKTAVGSSVADSHLEISGANWTSGNTASVKFTHNTVGDLMTIMTGGNVGIGTTSPTALLTLDGDNSTAAPQRILKLGGGTAVNGNGQYIQFSSSGNDALGSQIAGTRVGAGGSSDLRFSTTNSSGLVAERMRVTAGGAISLENANTSVIGRPYASGTVATGASVVSNLNSAGGNQSTGFIAISCVPPSAATGGAVALYTQLHTQGANNYTQLMLKDENGITITESSGSFTITNNSGSTANYLVKVLNLTDLDSTIAGV